MGTKEMWGLGLIVVLVFAFWVSSDRVNALDEQRRAVTRERERPFIVESTFQECVKNAGQGGPVPAETIDACQRVAKETWSDRK